MRSNEFPAVFMRGGAASGLFFHLGDVPGEGPERDRILVSAMGSPDPYGMQINGLGSGTTSTSKCVILSRSNQEGFDVDYLFAQVAVDRPEVDWTRSCGNLAAAAALFAVEEGLVDSGGEECVEFAMLQVNRKERIRARVERGTGNVWLTFENKDMHRSPIQGPSETFDVDVLGLGNISVTVIDATNSFTFVKASDLGADLDGDFTFADVKVAAERVRAAVVSVLGLPATLPGPRILLVDPPTDYRDGSGREIKNSEVDVIVRALSTRGMHHALPMSAVMAASVAAMTSGTLVHQLAREVDIADPVRVGHMSGVDAASPEYELNETAGNYRGITVALDARRIMTGRIHVPAW